jgi:hypothetical protein
LTIAVEPGSISARRQKKSLRHDPFERATDDSRQHARQWRQLAPRLLLFYEVVFGVEDYPDNVPVPAFAPRMVCTWCGMIGAAARPNWKHTGGSV